MKAIYFGDCGGDIDEERDLIQEELEAYDINMKIEATDLPPWDKYFDILFFDWGGMSMGNSMLEHFCRDIIQIAEDSPGRVFVMTSMFTREAMVEASRHLGKDRPSNIYLDIETAVNALRAFI